jgi:hypothetical protein
MNRSKSIWLVFYLSLLGLIAGCILAANSDSAPVEKISSALNQATPTPERASPSKPVVVSPTPTPSPYPTLAYLRQGNLWFFLNKPGASTYHSR